MGGVDDGRRDCAEAQVSLMRQDWDGCWLMRAAELHAAGLRRHDGARDCRSVCLLRLESCLIDPSVLCAEFSFLLYLLDVINRGDHAFLNFLISFLD